MKKIAVWQFVLALITGAFIYAAYEIESWFDHLAEDDPQDLGDAL